MCTLNMEIRSGEEGGNFVSSYHQKWIIHGMLNVLLVTQVTHFRQSLISISIAFIYILISRIIGYNIIYRYCQNIYPSNTNCAKW